MDRYGYLVNPGEDYQLVGNPKKSWLWLIGLAAAGLGIYWLARKKVAVGKYAGYNGRIPMYPVTAPSTILDYEGTDMPFDIRVYEPAPPTHIEVDYNGIARLYTNDGRAGGLVRVGGQAYFVTEEELNFALALTRQMNKDILCAVFPFALVGPGYLGYVTIGEHIGESVYITLAGQIGRMLNKVDGGELTFVPLEVVDQTDIWSTYVKQGG